MDRLARLRTAMERDDLDAVALVPGANFYFLTGASFHLMERPTLLVVTREGPLHAVMPLLERSRWQAAAPEAETSYWQDSDGFDGAFAALAARIAPRRIGVEGQRMRVFEAEALRRAFPDAAVVDAHSAIAHMRLHKDAGEIEAMRRAIAISEGALAATLAAAAAGMSEAEVARRLVAEMLDAGADGLAFDPIVLAGAGLRRPARHPEPRPPPGAGHAAADRLRRGLRRLHGRHHPHRLRRISGARAPRHLRGGPRRQRARPQHRRAADDPRHPRPPRHRQPARLAASPTWC